ncbi:MAG TPA: DedA family protein [bacterium]|nr:DedA family protein [bacterium]
MFDQVVQTITEYPYIGVAAVFLLCGLGFPLPEEVVLLAAGYVCAATPDRARLLPMMGWCAGAIAAGDMIPFLLGKIFGVRLLRLRWLRYFVTKQRLAVFDKWFRKRGDTVIVISRFVPGLRVVAFFTAGAMKMRILRFLFLDGTGIVLIVPLLTWLGFRSREFIDEAIARVQQVERGLLWGTIAVALLLTVWLWWRRRRRLQRQRREMIEAFVQPKKPVHGPPLTPGGPLPGEPADVFELPPEDPATLRDDDPDDGATGDSRNPTGP